MDLGLNGRTAVVTGGSKGLGFATVQALIDAGARVAFCARNAAEIKEAEEALGSGARGYVVDVTDAEQVEHFISEAAADFGGIDVLVNNAGGAHPGTGETITDDAFQADFNIKVLSWQRTIKAALPHLRKSDQARVINIGSVYAHSPSPAFFSTSVHRAAGVNLTKAWAVELAPDNILVNGVNIGVIETPQWANIRDKRAPGATMEEFFQATVDADIPLGRIGQPQELADVVAFWPAPAPPTSPAPSLMLLAGWEFRGLAAGVWHVTRVVPG